MEKVLAGLVIPAVSIFGIVCNMAFLFVLIRVQHMRTKVNFYLANLAVVDMCFLANTLWTVIWNVFYCPFPFSFPFTTSIGCAMFYWVGYIAAYGSMIFITLMSIERYLAICKPMYHLVISSTNRCIKLVVVSWIVSAILATDAIPANSKVFTLCYVWPRNDAFFNDIPIVARYCGPSSQMIVYAKAFHLLQPVPFSIALLSSIFCYSRIILQLNRRTITKSNAEQSGSSGSGNSPSQIKTRNDIAKMLVVNGIVFFLLSSPIHFIGTLDSIQRLTGNVWIPHRILKNMIWSGRCLLYLNSSINPIIFNVMSARYRDAFRQAFGFNKPSILSPQTRQ